MNDYFFPICIGQDVLFRLQEGMIFGLHWVSENMLLKFLSIIVYMAQLREVLLHIKVGETHMQVSSPASI